MLRNDTILRNRTFNPCTRRPTTRGLFQHPTPGRVSMWLLNELCSGIGGPRSNLNPFFGREGGMTRFAHRTRWCTRRSRGHSNKSRYGRNQSQGRKMLRNYTIRRCPNGPRWNGPGRAPLGKIVHNGWKEPDHSPPRWEWGNRWDGQLLSSMGGCKNCRNN